MKTLLLIVIINLTILNFIYSQEGVSINISGKPADSSAMLDISAKGKGLLIPRMNDVDRPVKPADALLIYNTTSQCFEAYNAKTSQWVIVACIGNFKCGSIITDSRDKKTYNTVLIGTQCWMKENLNIGTRINGINDQTNNGTLEKYCYKDSVKYCDIYGGLYQWAEMMQYKPSDNGTIGTTQGICPSGWHIPTDIEWTTLTTFLGGEIVAGGKMKETGITHWAGTNIGAINSSGFTALPGGFRYYDGGSF